MSIPDLTALHGLNKRPLLVQAGSCGCYSCGCCFPASSIKEWVRDEAFCPKCGIDACLPGDVEGFGVEMLAQLYHRWFGHYTWYSEGAEAHHTCDTPEKSPKWVRLHLKPEDRRLIEEAVRAQDKP